MDRACKGKGGSESARRTALTLLLDGKHLNYVARFRRADTKGMDERRLRDLRRVYRMALRDEEARIAIRELLKRRGALTEETQKGLQRATEIPAMEDFAAPYLPVMASRAMVARGLGLQPLADAILQATENKPLSELAQPFVKEGEAPGTLDEALGGARDIVAESCSIDAALRAKVRELFRRTARLKVSKRNDKKEKGEKGDSGPLPRHKNLIGLDMPLDKVTPMKLLAIRRAEKERGVVASIEPNEDNALALVYTHVISENHPYVGFLKAAVEDGYRRILKPLMQSEMRVHHKARADSLAMETFERNLKNLMLGPYAGPIVTLGIRPDVTNGHRWCAIDGSGLPSGSGQLPHEATAGREACVEELRGVLDTYNVQAIAVGKSGGRAEALSLAREAASRKPSEPKPTEEAAPEPATPNEPPTSRPPIVVSEVADGGTRALESSGPLEYPERPVVPAEARGALSIARRFQDPLSELVSIDAKALGLGPHLHDVHQGRLRAAMREVTESCVAHVGVNPLKASEDLMACVPGFTRKAAKGFVAWRAERSPMEKKASIAAATDVGPAIAEQAVGFLYLPQAEDPRDCTQLHPAQFDLVEAMAKQAGVDVPTLFRDPQARRRVSVEELANTDDEKATARYVLFQLGEGMKDPRPMHREMIPPPEGMKLADLQPGLRMNGRVLRAAPFGVFVDVGMGTEALIPVAHMGRPGVDPATVAPVGAVLDTYVVDVDPGRKRITLSLKPGPRAPGRGRPPSDRRPPRRPRRDGPAQQGGGGGERRVFAGRSGGRGGARRDEGPSRERGGASRGRGRPGRDSKQGRRGGKFDRGRGSGFDRGSRRRGPRFDKNTPRTISLKAEDPLKDKEAEIIDESMLTEEERMKRMLERLQKKFHRSDDPASES